MSDEPNNADKIKSIIDKLHEFVKMYDINSLFIGGDYCKSLWIDTEIKSIDIISAYEDQTAIIGSLFASEIMEKEHQVNNQICTINVDGINLVFQSSDIEQYMMNSEIVNYLNDDIKNIPLLHNVYSRQFTINTLLYSLTTKKVYDLTNLAIKHIDRKEVHSILPPEMLVKYKPECIFEAMYLSIKHNFHIDIKLSQPFQTASLTLDKSLSLDRILSEIVRILKIDSIRALDLLKKYKLDKFLLTKEIKDYV